MSDKLIGRKITYAKLHGGDTFVPGFGSFGNTLPAAGKSVKLDMEHTAIGIYVSINNGKAETMIPWANVQVATYAPTIAAVPFKVNATVTSINSPPASPKA
jgi:hypothetical protein